MTTTIHDLQRMSRAERRAHLLKMREAYTTENQHRATADVLHGQSQTMLADSLAHAQQSARLDLTIAEIMWGACDDTLLRDGTYRVVRGAEAACAEAAAVRLAEIRPSAT